MVASFDIDALRAIVAGAEQGSFARAANELGRSQSAVSMQLKKLEQQAGVDLFVRKGRGLAPTEAGEALIAYARQIIALNDEAARAIGAAVTPETVRLGLPQDFYDDVMPATVQAFSELRPQVHVTVRAGNNHAIADDVDAGRLDGAIAFFPKNARARGELICELSISWLARGDRSARASDAPVPLVLFNHPCLFRQAALAALDRAGIRWRAALTTPSLPAVWAALRSGFGVGARIAHNAPADLSDAAASDRLPELPPVELRLLGAQSAGPAAKDMIEILRAQTRAALLNRRRPNKKGDTQ